MDGLVPVVLAVPVEGREHDGQDGGGVVTDQAHNVPEDGVVTEEVMFLIEHNLLIVPVVKSSLRNLKMGAGDTLGELSE